MSLPLGCCRQRVAQVGSFNGGSISDKGAGGRFGAGPQIDPRDARATAQAAAAAPTSAATPIVGGTTWGGGNRAYRWTAGAGDKP